MADLTFTRSGELMVTQVIGNTDAGIEFVDAWYQDDLYVVDAGNIILRGVDKCEAAAGELGLTIEYDVIVTEKAT